MDGLRDEDLWTVLSVLVDRHPNVVLPLSTLSKRLNKAIRQVIPFDESARPRLTSDAGCISGRRVAHLRSEQERNAGGSRNPSMLACSSAYGRRLDLTIGYPGGGVWVEGYFDQECLSGVVDGRGSTCDRAQAVGAETGRNGLSFGRGGYLRRGRWEGVIAEVSDLSTFLEPFSHLTINQARSVSPPVAINAPKPLPKPLHREESKYALSQAEDHPVPGGAVAHGSIEKGSTRADMTGLSAASAPFVPSPLSPPNPFAYRPPLSSPGEYPVDQSFAQPFNAGGDFRPFGMLGRINYDRMGHQASPSPPRGGHGPNMHHRGGNGFGSFHPGINGRGMAPQEPRPDMGYPQSFSRFGPGFTGHQQYPANRAGPGFARGGGPHAFHPRESQPFRPPYQGQVQGPYKADHPDQRHLPMSPPHPGTPSAMANQSQPSFLPPMSLPMTPSASSESKASGIEITTSECDAGGSKDDSERDSQTTPISPSSLAVSLVLDSTAALEKEAEIFEESVAQPAVVEVENRRLTMGERMVQETQVKEILSGSDAWVEIEYRGGMGLRNEIWQTISSLPHIQRLSLLPPLSHPAHASPAASSTSGGGVPSIPRYNPSFRKGRDVEDGDLVPGLLERLTSFHVGNLGAVGTRNITLYLHSLSMLRNPPPLRVLDLSTVFLDAPLCTSIAELGSAGNLEELVISTTGTKLFDAGLKEVIEGCTGVRRLGLREVEGRLTKKVWKTIEAWPASLVEIWIQIDELGPYHTWFLDHLQSVSHLPLDQLESLGVRRTSPELCLMPVKPRNLHVPEQHDGCAAQVLPADFQGLLVGGTASKLRTLDLTWWKIDDGILTSIVKACPELVQLRVQVDFPLQKLLTLNILVTLNDLECLSVMQAPSDQRVVEVKAKSTKAPRGAKTSTSPVPASLEVEPIRPSSSRLPSYLAERSDLINTSLPLERDIKKFARKTNKLVKIEFVGHGVWTIIRPRTSGDKGMDKKGQQALTADFVPSAVGYREAWELGESVVPIGGYEDLPGQEITSDVPPRDEDEGRKAAPVSRSSAPVPMADKNKAIAEWSLAAIDFPKLPTEHEASPARMGDKVRGKGANMAISPLPITATGKSKEIYKRSVLAGLAAGAGPAGGPPETIRSGRGKPIMGSRAVAALAENPPRTKPSGSSSSVSGEKGQDQSGDKASKPSDGPKGYSGRGKQATTTNAIATRPSPFASSFEALTALTGPGPIPSGARGTSSVAEKVGKTPVPTGQKKRDVMQGGKSDGSKLPSAGRQSSTSTVATNKSGAAPPAKPAAGVATHTARGVDDSVFLGSKASSAATGKATDYCKKASIASGGTAPPAQKRIPPSSGSTVPGTETAKATGTGNVTGTGTGTGIGIGAGTKSKAKKEARKKGSSVPGSGM